MTPARIVSEAPRYVVGALIIAITLLVNVEVGLRFFVDLPLDKLSEAVSFLSPWLSMLGAAVAVNTAGAHVAVHLLSDRLPVRCRICIRVFVSVVTFGFGVFLILQGIRYTRMTYGELSNALEISRSWKVSAFAAAGVLFVFYSFVSILTLVRRRRTRMSAELA